MKGREEIGKKAGNNGFEQRQWSPDIGTVSASGGGYGWEHLYLWYYNEPPFICSLPP